MNAIDRVLRARDKDRPKITDYIDNVFTDFFQQKGDYLGKDDKSIYGGIALFHGRPVTVIGHRKGNSVEENIDCNFGMPGPEGYRKALRLMKQAEKFGRPIITFVDTPGAYPGLEAEMFGQAQAIAENLAGMSALKVPVISIVTGEGSSGGALGIAVANRVYMLENAIYSVLSPEGFASILWHDSARRDEAAEVMKLTAQDLLEFGVIDGIISERGCGLSVVKEEDNINPFNRLFTRIDKQIAAALKEFDGMSGQELAAERFNKFRKMDERFLTETSQVRMGNI
ncbi:acetyl-CoA carboxylase carboxyl transferase subunit alpha [Pseudobutyrivibrio sp.]|uniref:acetyl-CoA carboxylase carboxyl transferase subunit alpha n=1 Tax=Pseudobutyrivibrio sp. TaxID=2014367 RepID=UPI001D5B0EDA|nr:acetyl-CoA carboxylase carboxyl transferase subunit alpha [Pseudobutyrivibrio sp.]MBE5911319.1 acetyl-CoA carboxylase carboxyl transferase subunit alpha [Pseudobutyrivibrio sp.]